MCVLEINLFKHPSGVAFDPDKVIQNVKLCFPEAIVLPGDQATAEVQRAEAFLARELQTCPAGPANQVVQSLRRKARSFGPAYAFLIPREGCSPIQGLARSVNVQFVSQEPLSDQTRQRLISFLKTLGVGWIRASTNDKRQFEVLDDLREDSAYLREDVPWKHPT